MPGTGLRYALLAALASICLLWPALFNGQAVFMTDTSAYLRGAAMGVQSVTGVSSPWSEAGPAPSMNGTASASAASAASAQDAPRPGTPAEFRSLSSVEDRTVLAGRSVYYGALLFLGSLTAGFWPTIAVQSLLLVVAAMLTLQACGVLTTTRAATAMALLGLTPAALFVSYLMPDIFAALTILSCAGLLVAGQHRRPWHGVYWFLLLVFALLAHSSHVLIAASLLLVGGALASFSSLPIRARGLWSIAAALAASFAGGAVFDYGVTRFVGAPPIRPPFLMARLIADGPGHDYLVETCPGNGFIACRYLERMPATADEFLWSLNPGVGVFALVDPATRRALSGEQYRFVAQVLVHAPAAQLGASLRNALTQAVAIDTKEFEYSAWDRRFYEAKLPSAVLKSMRDTAAFNGRMPIAALTALSYLTATAALAYLLFVLGSTRGRVLLQDRELRLVLVVVLAGVGLNALICGAMSTPHDRYQARVAWLLPLVALIIAFRMVDARRPAPAPSRVAR